MTKKRNFIMQKLESWGLIDPPVPTPLEEALGILQEIKRKAMEDPTFSVILDFNLDHYPELEAVMAATGQSLPELLSNSVVLFKWAVEQAQQGRKIGSMSEGSDDLREVHMKSLETAAQSAS